MNGHAIPGFYYDTEKNKYFKIQSAAASRDQPDLKYSAKNLRRKEREERAQGMADFQVKRVRKERVVRRRTNNLTQVCQDREIGAKRPSHYMHTSHPSACMSGVASEPSKVIHDPPTGGTVRLFDFDPISKCVYIVHGDNSIKRRPLHAFDDQLQLPTYDFDQVDAYLDSLPRDFDTWEELQRTTSTASSLTFLPISGALATTTYGSDRAPVVYLTDPDRDGPYVGQQFTPKGCTAIFAAAARPHSSQGHSNESQAEYLAVGASTSLLIFTRSWTGSWDSSTPLPTLPSDVLALDWIDQTTVAFGCRDGTIRLYDARSGGSTHVLTHPFPISKLKRADDPMRLLASGLNDSLHLYDIRAPRPTRRTSWAHRNQHYNDSFFRHLYPGGNNFQKRRNMSHFASRNWSQPVLSFAHYNVDDLFHLDMAVHARLGLVAAGQGSESSTAIRVSNIWTGKVVKEFKNQGKQHIRCLKFREEHGEDGDLELWANWDGGISKFAW